VIDRTQFDALLSHIERSLSAGCTDYVAMRRDLNETADLLNLLPAEEDLRKKMARRLLELTDSHDGSISEPRYLPFASAEDDALDDSHSVNGADAEWVEPSLVESGTPGFDTNATTQTVPPVTGADLYSEDADDSPNDAPEPTSLSEPTVESQARARSEVPAIQVDEPAGWPEADEALEPEDAFSGRNQPRITYTNTLPVAVVTAGDPHETLLRKIQEGLNQYQRLPFDFNGRLRDLDSIRDPQQTLSAALYELFVQTRQQLLMLRQRAFDEVRAEADAVYMDPSYTLEEKLEKLDRARDPRWTVVEDAGYASLEQRRDALTSDWNSEEKATKALEHIEYGLQAEFDNPESQEDWLKRQERIADDLIAASTLPAALVDRARTAKQTISALRQDLQRATYKTSSRNADRDYVSTLAVLESQRGRVKEIYDEILKRTFALDDLIEQVEYEYAEYALTNGKNQLQNALGNETLVREVLAAAYKAAEARTPYEYTGTLKADAALEDIESSLELGLVHLMPQEFPALITKLGIQQDRSRNPRRQGLAKDADSQRDFDGLRASLPALLKHVQDIMRGRATDRSLRGLLKVYEAWQNPETLRALDNMIQQEWGRTDAIWKTFKDEWERGDLWLLYADDASFDQRLTTIEGFLDGSLVSQVSISAAHPYAHKLQAQKERLEKLKNTVSVIRNGRTFVDSEKASLGAALESIRRQLGGSTAATRLRVSLENIHDRVDALSLSPYFYPADDLRQMVSALRIEADQKTGDVELVAELATTLDAIYRDAARRDDVTEWDSLEKRAAERFKNEPVDGQSDAASGYALYLFAVARGGLLKARKMPGTDEGIRERNELLAVVELHAQKLLEFLEQAEEDVWQKTRIQRRWREDLLKDIEQEGEAAKNAQQYRNNIEEFRSKRRKLADQQGWSHLLPEMYAYARIAQEINQVITETEDLSYQRTLTTYLFDEFRREWDAALSQAVQAFLSDPKPPDQKRRVIRDNYDTATQVTVRLTESLKKAQDFRDKSRNMVNGRYHDLLQVVDTERPPDLLFDLLHPLEVSDYEELFLQAKLDADDNPISANIRSEGVAAAYYLLALAEIDPETRSPVAGDTGRQAIVDYLARIYQRTPIAVNDPRSQAMYSVQRRGTAYMLRDGYLMSYWFDALTVRANPKIGPIPPEQRIAAEEQANQLTSADIEINRIGLMWKKRLSIIHAATDGLNSQALNMMNTFKAENDKMRAIADFWARRRHYEMWKSISDLEVVISGCGEEVYIDATPESYLRALEQAIRCRDMGATEESDRLFRRLTSDKRLQEVDRLLHKKLKTIIEQTLADSLLRANVDTLLLADQVRTLAHGLDGLNVSGNVLDNLKDLEKRLDNVSGELRIACEQYESGRKQLINVILNREAANYPDNWNLSQVATARVIVKTQITTAVAYSAQSWPYEDDPALTAPYNPGRFGQDDYDKFSKAFETVEENTAEIQQRTEHIRTVLHGDEIRNPRVDYADLSTVVEEVHSFEQATNQELNDLKFNRPETPEFYIPDDFFRTAPARNLLDLTLYVTDAVKNDAKVREIFSTAHDITAEAEANQWKQDHHPITRIQGLHNHRVVLALMRYRVVEWAKFWDNLTKAYETYLTQWATLGKAIAYTDELESKIRQIHHLTNDASWPEYLDFRALAGASYAPSHTHPGTNNTLQDSVQRVAATEKALVATANSMAVIGENLNISRDLHALRDDAAAEMARLEDRYAVPPALRQRYSNRLNDGIRRSNSVKQLCDEVKTWLAERESGAAELGRKLSQFEQYCATMSQTVRDMDIPNRGRGRQNALETDFLLRRAMWLLLDDKYTNEPTMQK